MHGCDIVERREEVLDSLLEDEQVVLSSKLHREYIKGLPDPLSRCLFLQWNLSRDSFDENIMYTPWHALFSSTFQ